MTLNLRPDEIIVIGTTMLVGLLTLLHALPPSQFRSWSLKSISVVFAAGCATTVVIRADFIRDSLLDDAAFLTAAIVAVVLAFRRRRP